MLPPRPPTVQAKYGKRGEDGKMSREQYQALRRKVGGTAKDYWKVSLCRYPHRPVVKALLHRGEAVCVNCALPGGALPRWPVKGQQQSDQSCNPDLFCMYSPRFLTEFRAG